MLRITDLLDRFLSRLHDDEGASAVEYGLIVSLIAAAIVTVVATMGNHLATLFTTISSSF
jgi:pilus assembly protein Flp/PilA